MQLTYLAYGSNLHPVRLRERIPSAQFVEVVPLPGQRLAFHKRGQDGSGKCDLVATGHPGDIAWGALYTMDAAEKPLLDEFEGPGYAVHGIGLRSGGERRQAFVYLALGDHIDPALRPYAWYHRIVMLGAQFLDLPPEYIAPIAAIDAIDDPDAERAARNEGLILRLDW